MEVLDTLGHVAFSRSYVPDADKGKRVIDPTHCASLAGARARRSSERIDDAFLARFPQLAPFVDGLLLRMKSFTQVHIRRLIRLSDRFGEPGLMRAVLHAHSFRRFETAAVERIPPPPSDDAGDRFRALDLDRAHLDRAPPRRLSDLTCGRSSD